jgi:hypothetical protein
LHRYYQAVTLCIHIYTYVYTYIYIHIATNKYISICLSILSPFEKLGYAAVAIAEGLNKALNVDIVQVRAGAGAFDLVKTISTLMTNVRLGSNLDGYLYMGPLLGHSFSSTNPDVANYNAGQDLLSTKYTDPLNPDINLVEWLEEEGMNGYIYNQRFIELTASVNLTSNAMFDEIINSTIVSFFTDALANNVTDPCSESYSEYEVGITDKICQALLDNSLIDDLYNVQYPVQVCHSVDDELVTYNNVPDVTRNDYLSVVPVTGDHGTAGATCITADIFSFASPAFTTYETPSKHEVDGCGTTNESTCADSPYRFKLIKDDGSPMFRDCVWADKKSTNIRCGYEHVANTCPLTCDTCDDCIDSTSRFKFFYNGKKITR